MTKYDLASFTKLFHDADCNLPVMLEDRRMGLCSHINDTHALVDVYRGNDHDGQLHIPFGNFIDVPMIGLVAGLAGVDRTQDFFVKQQRSGGLYEQDKEAALRRNDVPDDIMASVIEARRLAGVL